MLTLARLVCIALWGTVLVLKTPAIIRAVRGDVRDLLEPVRCLIWAFAASQLTGLIVSVTIHAPSQTPEEAFARLGTVMLSSLVAVATIALVMFYRKL